MSADSQPKSDHFEIHTDRVTPLSTSYNPSAFSLKFVFQMVTACAIFFAVFNIAPVFAILATAIAAPAIVRTVLIGDRRRRQAKPFGWERQLATLLGSVGVVMLTVGLAIGAFLAISLAFGVLGMLMSMMLGSASQSGDAAVVGTAGGMIWGFAGSILAVGYSLCKLWFPEE